MFCDATLLLSVEIYFLCLLKNTNSSPFILAEVNAKWGMSRAGFIAAELERHGGPNGMNVKTGRGGIADNMLMEANRHTKVELYFF